MSKYDGLDLLQMQLRIKDVHEDLRQATDAYHDARRRNNSWDMNFYQERTEELRKDLGEMDGLLYALLAEERRSR